MVVGHTHEDIGGMKEKNMFILIWPRAIMIKIIHISTVFLSLLRWCLQLDHFLPEL